MAVRTALLCIDNWEGKAAFQPFNYAVRRVQASLLSDPANGGDVHLVESRSADVDEFVERVEELDADVIGCSTYVWSFSTFVEVARRLKRRRKDRTVVFGGPSARPVMASLPKWAGRMEGVDALVMGEGEEVFRRIVGAPDRSRDGLCEVDGIAINTGDGWSTTRPAKPIEDLSALPSVYRSGLTQAHFSAHLETYRGCPMSCAFCQWGDLDAKSRGFSADYLADELIAIEQAGIRDILMVDAALNLNSRAFRNLVEAERRTGVLRNVGLQFEVYPTLLQDHHLRFLEGVKVRGIGVGLQSFDRDVLSALGRPFDQSKFMHAIQQLKPFGPVTIEIIFGLPGDNPKSFRDTLERAIETGCEIRAFHCLVLPDALMTRAPSSSVPMEFDQESLRITSCDGWSEQAFRDAHRWLDRLTEETGGFRSEGMWTIPAATAIAGPVVSDVAPNVTPARGSGVRPAAGDEVALVAAAVAAASGDWMLVDLSWSNEVALVTVDTTRGNQLVLELAPHQRGTPAFRASGGVAISYRGEIAGPDLAVLEHGWSVLVDSARRLLGARVSLPVLDQA